MLVLALHSHVRRWCVTAVAALMMVVALCLTAPVAAADVPKPVAGEAMHGHGVLHFTELPVGRQSWLGSFRTFGLAPAAYCADKGRLMPRPDGVHGTRTHKWQVIGEYQSPATAFILSTQSDSQDPYVQEAIATIVHADPAVPHRAIAPVAAPTAQGVAERDRLLAEAARLAGPYVVEVALDHVGLGTVVVRSAAGESVPDVVVSLSATNAELGSGRVTTTPTGAQFSYAAQAAGDVVVTATATVSSTAVWLWDSGHDAVQRVVTRAEAVEVVGSGASRHYVPAIATELRSQVVEAGTVLADDTVLTGFPADTAVELVTTLYGPFTERPVGADVVPQDAPVWEVLTETVTTDGEGSWQGTLSGTKVVTETGWFTAVESAKADVGADGMRFPAVQGTYGRVEETALVDIPLPTPSPTQSESPSERPAPIAQPTQPAASLVSPAPVAARITAGGESGAVDVAALLGGAALLSGGAVLGARATVRSRGGRRRGLRS